MTKLKIPVKKLKPYWTAVEKVQDEFFTKIKEIEKEMQTEFKNEHIRFFWVEGELSGIGTPDYPNEMDLIQDTDLSKV